jgi:hypothetical protein
MMTSSFVQHFDRCLGCVAVTACPSGVQYPAAHRKTRAQIEQLTGGAPDRLFSHSMALVSYPRRLRFAILRSSSGRGRSAIGRALTPEALWMSDVRVMQPSGEGGFGAISPLPACRRTVFAVDAAPASRNTAGGGNRGGVTVLTGCVQRRSPM